MRPNTFFTAPIRGIIPHLMWTGQLVRYLCECGVPWGVNGPFQMECFSCYPTCYKLNRFSLLQLSLLFFYDINMLLIFKRFCKIIKLLFSYSLGRRPLFLFVVTLSFYIILCYVFVILLIIANSQPLYRTMAQLIIFKSKNEQQIFNISFIAYLLFLVVDSCMVSSYY